MISVGDEVCITWHDSAGQGGAWEFCGEVKADTVYCEVRSWGVIIDVRKDYVLIAPHYAETSVENSETQCRGAVAIPVCCIKSVRHLHGKS